MSNYITTVNLKRTTLTLIASRIPEDQITNLREAFSKFDSNGDGRLNLEELKSGIKKVPGIGLKEEDVEKVMAVMDANNNGFIDYTEFIAGCLQSYNYLQETHLRAAFTYFDKDGSGTISKEELRACLQNEDFTMSDDIIEGLLKEADKNGDGSIDYTEFLEMMKSNSDD